MADIVFPGQTGTTLNESSLPANHDLVIYKGDSLELLVAITNAVGTPMTLTGAVVVAWLKSDYNDRDPKPFTCVVTATPGEVAVSMSDTLTSGLLPGSYIWDFQVTYASGITRTYIAGDVTVYNDVTSVSTVVIT